MALNSAQISDLRDIVNFESFSITSKASVTAFAAGLDADDEALTSDDIDRWAAIKGKFTRTKNALNWGVETDPRDEKVAIRDRNRTRLGLPPLGTDGQGGVEIAATSPTLTARTRVCDERC
jgi:hypothetical protein